MNGIPGDISMEMYHRIYRLAIKGSSVDQIAATLSISGKTVRSVIDRLNHAQVARSAQENVPETYLDIYIANKAKYMVLEIMGMIVPEQNDVLRVKLAEMLNSDFKTLAIMTREVKAVNAEGFATILSFYMGFVNKGRYCAILDPSPCMERFIEENGIEKKMLVFGTEKAFEAAAFKAKAQK